MAQLPIVRAAFASLLLLFAAQQLSAQPAPNLECPECELLAKALDSLREERARTQAQLSKAELIALDRRIFEAGGRLTGCRLKCIGLAMANAGPPPQLQTTPPATPPAPETTPLPPAKCPDCEREAKALESFNQQKREWLERLENLELRRGARLAEAEQDKADIAALKRQTPTTPEISARIEALTKHLTYLSGLWIEFAAAEQTIEEELARLEELITSCLINLLACNNSCRRTTISKPLIYLGLGGAAVGGVIVGTGGDDGPASTTSSPPPVAAPAPVPTPAPAPTPAPTTPTPPVGLNPTGRHNILNCICAIDAANFNAVLQFCRVTQITITASPSAGTIVVAAPAPLSTITGSYNTTTGEFDLASTALVNGAAVQVRFRGTFTSAGNVTNGTLTFNQTEYRFSTVNVGS